MNNFISLSDFTEEDLSKIIDDIYPSYRNYVSRDCNGGCRKKGNKIMCKDLCKNSNNYTENDLNSIKEGMGFVLGKNIKIEEKLFRKYIVEKINKILLKKELEN